MKMYAIPLVLAFATATAGAEEVGTLQDAINRAVLQSPSVNASWHEFEASREGQRAGEGGYYPKVDLNAQAGRERQRISNGPGWSYYDPLSAEIVLNQLLFDGFSTKNEVERLSQTRQLRYYEFLGASEESALEAIRAYLDTLRYQRLVDLAKDSYVEHRNVYDDIEDRTGAGVGREVDLEQASARLALAESNLLTEVTNLHDVSARFERVVGALPADSLAVPTLSVDMIPAERDLALTTAYTHNPSLNAALRNIAAADAALKARKAAYSPRLDLRLAKTLEDEVDNVAAQIHQEGVHVVLTYNLYNGGSDSARIREFHEKANMARELRDKVCRDVKQEVVIAFNDINSLEEQVSYLDRNQLAIGKARQAYRNQFNIGKRTLLDLLDTENEYFEVRRAFVNAENDLQLARMRTLTGMGRLLSSLSQNSKGADRDSPVTDELSPCPLGGPKQLVIDKNALINGIMEDSRFRKTDTGDLAFSMRAEFSHNSSALASEYEKDITDGADFLKTHSGVNAIIEGHTDSTGTEEYNRWLSERRAASVHDRLVELGVAKDRLTIVGKGEGSPIADNGTKAGRRHNRRVDMVMEGFDAKKE